MKRYRFLQTRRRKCTAYIFCHAPYRVFLSASGCLSVYLSSCNRSRTFGNYSNLLPKNGFFLVGYAVFSESRNCKQAPREYCNFLFGCTRSKKEQCSTIKKHAAYNPHFSCKYVEITHGCNQNHSRKQRCEQTFCEIRSQKRRTERY